MNLDYLIREVSDIFDRAKADAIKLIKESVRDRPQSVLREVPNEPVSEVIPMQPVPPAPPALQKALKKNSEPARNGQAIIEKKKRKQLDEEWDEQDFVEAENEEEEEFEENEESDNDNSANDNSNSDNNSEDNIESMSESDEKEIYSSGSEEESEKDEEKVLIEEAAHFVGKSGTRGTRGRRLVKKPIFFEPADFVHNRHSVVADERNQDRNAENTKAEFNSDVLQKFRAAIKQLRYDRSIPEFFQSPFCRENKAFLNFCDISAKNSGNALRLINSQKCVQEFENIIAACDPRNPNGGVRFIENNPIEYTICSLCGEKRCCSQKLTYSNRKQISKVVGCECAFLGEAVIAFAVFLFQISEKPEDKINESDFRHFDFLHSQIMIAQQNKSWSADKKNCN